MINLLNIIHQAKIWIHSWILVSQPIFTTCFIHKVCRFGPYLLRNFDFGVILGRFQSFGKQIFRQTKYCQGKDPFPKRKSSNAWCKPWGFPSSHLVGTVSWTAEPLRATLTSAVPLDICSVNATKRSIIACLSTRIQYTIFTFHQSRRDDLLIVCTTTNICIYIYTYIPDGYSLLNGSCLVSLVDPAGGKKLRS